MSLKVEPIKPLFGAVIHVDKAALRDPAVARECAVLLNKHGILVFPKIHMTDEEQLDLTDKLGGSLNFTSHVAGGDKTAEGVYQVTLDPRINSEPEYVLATFFYHMDGMTSNDAPPPKATLLSCRTKAPKGGQTQFASTAAAWAGLPQQERDELKDLKVVHTVTAGVREVATPESLEPVKRARNGERPLVWKEKSGVESLLIGYTADYVVGQTQAEGRALLVRLLEWAAQPEFSYSHEWSEGDLVIWDNRAALHRVIPYSADSGRTMHRTSLIESILAQ